MKRSNMLAATAGVLAALLFEVDPADPAILFLAAAFLLLVSGVATWLPARRAARVDVSRALRTE